jgi:mRNA interferase MazF
VLVVQADAFNDSQIRTAVCAVITSNLRLAEAPGNVRLTRKASGLPQESVLNVSQLITLDRTVLTERLGQVSAEALRSVDAGLRLVLAL